MKNREIQEKRIKNYFVEATREILKGEGLQAVSVRNVADRAGYSYATLYNYFKDINELIFVCVSDFQKECKTFVAGQSSKKTKGTEKLKASVLAYIHYFVEYPGIFDLFYLAKPSGAGINSAALHLIATSLDDVCEEDWNYCIRENLIPAENIENLKSQLRFSVTGMLLFYMNRRYPETHAEFLLQVKKQVDTIIKTKSEPGWLKL
jgi:AcrR family transcriptional regulator